MRSQAHLRVSDLMTREMISIDEQASIREVAALLIDREISGAPVRDSAGRIVGVISLRDIARYERERGTQTALGQAEARHTPGLTSRVRRSQRAAGPAAERGQQPYPAEPEVELEHREAMPYGYHVETEEAGRVRDFMTPVTITVPADASLDEAARTMLWRKVHRLLVSDEKGHIVGILSAIDLLRQLAGR